MEDSERDEYTQNSVSIECNASVGAEKPQNDEEMNSPQDTGDRSSPMTVFHAGDIPYGGSAFNLEAFNNTQEKLEVRKFVSISETLEENCKLRSSNLRLQLENISLKKELPGLQYDDGANVAMKYIKCKNALNDAENMKSKLETELKEVSEKLEAYIREQQKEREKWEEEKKQLVASVNHLKTENEKLFNENAPVKSNIMKLPEEAAALSNSVYDSDVSQGESSIFSERDQQLEMLQRKMAMNSTEAEVMRRNFLKQIDCLVADLEKKDGELKQLSKKLEVEKDLRHEIQVENVRLQDMFGESEKCKESLRNQLEENRKQHEADVFKRDRAINALMRRCEAAKVPEKVFFANENDKVLPGIAGILHRVQEIDEKNVKIREKAIKLATEGNATFDDVTSSSDVFSTGDDMSEVNITQFIAKNKMIAEYLGAACFKQQQDMDPSLRKEVQCKMAAFDAIEACDDCNSIMRYSRTGIPMKIGGLTADGVLNASRVMNKDVEGLKQKVTLIRKICVQLFEKLRGSAETFQKILDQLYGNDEGHSLLEEVEAIRLDFNQSVGAADCLLNNFEVVQKSILELTDVFEHSVLPHLCNTSDGCEVSIFTQKESFTEDQLKAVEKELEAEQELTKRANLEVEELTKKLQELEKSNKKLLEDRNMAEQNIAEITSKLREANDEIDRMKNACICHTEGLLKLESENKEKKNELKQVSNQLVITQREFAKYKVYFEELTSVEAESKRLIQSLRETISSIPRKVVKVITGAERIVGESDEALKVAVADKDVIALRDEFNQMRTTIDETSCNVEALKVKYDEVASKAAVLKQQKESVEVELADLRKKFSERDTKSVQTNLSQMQMMQREAEYERCAMDSHVSKENVDRLCAALNQLQEGHEGNGISLLNASQVTQDVCHREKIFCTKVGVMTDLRCSDIVRIEGELLEYTNFANAVYGIVTKKRDQPFDHKCYVNIQKLEKLKADISKIFMAQQEWERNSTKLSVKQLSQRAEVEEADSSSSAASLRHLKSSDVVNSTDSACNVDDAENASKDSDVVFANEICFEMQDRKMGSLLCKILTDKFWKRIFDYSNEIVQLIKAHKSQGCEWDTKDKLLVKARAFRNKIHVIREKVNGVEKLKENVDPSMTVNDLQEKVLDLQHELSNASRLLKEADERLSKQPNTDSMRTLIREEMAKIRDVMKAVGNAAANDRILGTLLD